MSMRREREGNDEPPREAGRETSPDAETGRAGDRAAANEVRAESSERRTRAEAANEVREAKDRIADALWEKPAAFAEYAAGQGSGGNLSRFLEAFAALDDETLRSDKLKRARDAAAGAPREGGAA